MPTFTIRAARENEAATVLEFIKKLAEYEKLAHEVEATEVGLREALFVLPEKRGLGYGKALLHHLAKLALERHCGRMEWVCLDWNQPSIDFYKSIGAVPMEDWTIYRLTEEKLKTFAHDNFSGSRMF